ncbi:O-antigen ligase family protein [Patescibacteria group bacterium]|nr:O-antigen ligase family protein [Patescibacteria group bacterium]MBU1954324.1 O-antigen ligase family protein [Patescibacteria group bacterium]
MPKVIFWVIGAIIASAASALLSSRIFGNPLQIFLFAAVVILPLLLANKPRSALYIIIFLPVLGELGRLSIGAGGLSLSGIDLATTGTGTLAADIFIPIFLFGWLISRSEIRVRQHANKTGSEVCEANTISPTTITQPPPPLTLPFTLFIIIATLSLIHSLTFLPAQDVAAGSLYLIRFLEYGLLYFVTIHALKTHPDPRSSTKNIITAITISALIIAIIGFIQLVIFPNLTALEQAGYDPHINRLVATWLDPNFLGGFFAFIISILLGIMLFTKKIAHKTGLLFIIAILATALFFTYSRSAYLALATGIFIISLIQSRKILLITLALFLIGLSISPRAQERVGELTQSMAAITGASAQTPDPTAKLRLESWGQTIQLIQKRPLLGSGYNTLRSVNFQEGFIQSPDTHSAAGSDSSLLTILATTGILGFIPFLLLYLIPIKTAWQNLRDKKIPALSKGFSLGLIGAIAALLVHSIFINSLLFPQILIFFWISLGLLKTKKEALIFKTLDFKDHIPYN